MTTDQKHAAVQFVERWTAAEGNELREANKFWIQLLEDVLRISNPTRVLDFERKAQGRRIDIFFEDMGILIENKSRGVDLDTAYERGKNEGGDTRLVTPYEQAKWYADNLPRSISPRWIIVCNFDTFRVHDLNLADPKNDYVEIQLSELPQQYQLFSFFTDQRNSRLIKEQELSVKAGEIVGRLYSALSEQYKNIDTDEHEQKSLNVLIVRLVFLLYAEDADLLHERDAFLNYMKTIPAASMRNAIIDLFKVLDTKPEDRDPYLDDKLLAFPYINGGLFAREDILIPQFTDNIRLDLLLEASQKFDWRDISPTIFGAVFESTLNPETRRSGGMHYTSIENIHKVIDPLFLDDLKQELAAIEGERVVKNRKIKLLAFQRKLAGLNIFDPACGSGNFLTESYLSLRKLENRIFEDLQGYQMGLGFDGDADPIQVHISQFYGVEINDFAVSVAKTALWIAEEQAMEQTQEIMLKPFDFLPLKSNANIREGNALRLDWNEVLPAERCSHICGNPPFIGYKEKSPQQKDDLENTCTVEGKTIRNVGSVDYVAGWYYKAAQFMQLNKDITAAFVSTNSLCQGEQVCWAWKPLFEKYSVNIFFAHKSFVWDSEATDKAHVHVVIIGFSVQKKTPCTLYSNGKAKAASRINAYLTEATDVWIKSRRKPLCAVKEIKLGVHLLDNHHFIFSEEEKRQFIVAEPKSEPFFRPWVSAKDFLYGKNRWFLDLSGCPKRELLEMPNCNKLAHSVIEYRSNNKSCKGTQLETDPFKPKQGWKADCGYLAIPNTSGENRKYLPVTPMDSCVVITMPDLAIPHGGLYELGILSSSVHMAWISAVAGRLENSFRYANGIVYNNFIWPDSTDEQCTAIETRAQAVLDARDNYPDKSLADLYDPDKMPSDLLAAHKSLDKAVEAAYGVNFNGDEEMIVAHLFKLYAEATKEGSDA